MLLKNYNQSIWGLIKDKSLLIKNGSLANHIYFLLILRPLTASDISKKVYDGKVQLSQIIRVLDMLEKEKIIGRVELDSAYLKKNNYDARSKFYSANFLPFFDYCIKKLSERGSTSLADEKKLTKDDIRAMDLILNSNWFKDIIRYGYHAKLEIGEKKIPHSTLDALGYTFEDICAINETYSIQKKFETKTVQEFIEIESFDLYLDKIILNDKNKRHIRKILRYAEKTLGNYSQSNKYLELFHKNYGVVFLPSDLAYKLSALVRVPLTLFLHFMDAAKAKEYKRKFRP